MEFLLDSDKKIKEEKRVNDYSFKIISKNGKE